MLLNSLYARCPVKTHGPLGHGADNLKHKYGDHQAGRQGVLRLRPIAIRQASEWSSAGPSCRGPAHQDGRRKKKQHSIALHEIVFIRAGVRASNPGGRAFCGIGPLPSLWDCICKDIVGETGDLRCQDEGQRQGILRLRSYLIRVASAYN